MATITGTLTSDVLNGAASVTLLPTTLTLDQVDGSGGDDLIYWSPSTLVDLSGLTDLALLGQADRVDGGTGIDVLSFAGGDFGSAPSVRVTIGSAPGGDSFGSNLAVVNGTVSLLGSPVPGLLGGSVTSFINTERVVGSVGSDSLAVTLTVSPADIFLDGGGGADTIDGNNVGTVFADYASAASGVVVNLAAGTGTVAGVVDALANVVSVRGSNFDDTLIGNAADNVFRPGLGDNVVDGAGGTNVLSFADVTGLVTVVLTAPGAGTVTVGGAGGGVTTFTNVARVLDNLGNLIDATVGPVVGLPPTTVQGTPGDDVLTGSMEGRTIYEGGAGYDVVQFQLDVRRAVNFTAHPDGTVSLVHENGSSATLSGIERVDFVDGSQVFDLRAPVTQVVRLYRAALDRDPEQAGLNYHAANIENGATLAGVASNFLDSPEFQARYGVGLSTDAYIRRLYDNVLDRSPSESEISYYRDQLAQGTSRAQVLVNFSESPENVAKTAPLTAAGIWDLDESAAMLARVYNVTFGRLPDVAGVAYHRDRLEAGTANPIDVVNNFITSPEFERRYGSGVSNTEFVELLYINALERPDTAAEEQYYVSRLNSGVLTRAEVVLAFSESPEHASITKEQVMSDNPGDHGIAFA